MSRWIRYSGGRLTYSGAVSRGPFAAWADTPAGRAVVGSAAERVRFSLFGKERAARKRMWREIAEAGSDGSVIAAVQREADGYVRRLGKLAYGEGLPRVTVNLRRLVILPRQLLGQLICHVTGLTGSDRARLRIWKVLTGVQDLFEDLKASRCLVQPLLA